MKLTDQQRTLLKQGKGEVVVQNGEPVFALKLGAKGVRDGRAQEDRARSSQGGPGWVYLVQAEGSQRCKIGRSVDVAARLKRLNEHGNSIPAFEIVLVWKRRVLNDKIIEDHLHERYKVQRVRGEWFDLSDEQIGEIVALSADQLNAICEQHDDPDRYDF